MRRRLLLLCLLGPFGCKAPSATIPPSEPPVAATEQTESPRSNEELPCLPGDPGCGGEHEESEFALIGTLGADDDGSADVLAEGDDWSGLQHDTAGGVVSGGAGTTPTTGYGGSGFGGRGKPVPRVRQAKAKVIGALDRDIIRRIVRAHINEVRSCYNQVLSDHPAAEGRVEVEFVIGSTGAVTSSKVVATTVTGRDPGPCIAKAVRRWKFPKPKGGGEVVVSYPFIMAPA